MQTALPSCANSRLINKYMYNAKAGGWSGEGLHGNHDRRVVGAEILKVNITLYVYPDVLLKGDTKEVTLHGGETQGVIPIRRVPVRRAVTDQTGDRSGGRRCVRPALPTGCTTAGDRIRVLRPGRLGALPDAHRLESV